MYCSWACAAGERLRCLVDAAECWTRGCGLPMAGFEGESLFPRRILTYQREGKQESRRKSIQRVEFEQVGMRIGGADDLFVLKRLCGGVRTGPPERRGGSGRPWSIRADGVQKVSIDTYEERSVTRGEKH
jgi:hypothetical protein